MSPDEYQDRRPGEQEQDRREFIAGMLEHADQYEGSITNPVYQTEMGTTLKKFEPSMTEYFVALGKLPGGQWDKPKRDDRIQNEQEYRTAVKEAGLDVPEVLGKYEEYMEVETVDGDTLPEYLNQTSGEDAEDVGRELGQSIRQLHEGGYAIVDLRANNIMVRDDRSLVSIDHEYATDHATDWEKKMDLITLISSARQTKEDTYQRFREGFEDGYGEDISNSADVLASGTSMLHAALLERDLDRFSRGVKNSIADIDTPTLDGLDEKLQGYISRD